MAEQRLLGNETDLIGPGLSKKEISLHFLLKDKEREITFELAETKYNLNQRLHSHSTASVVTPEEGQFFQLDVLRMVCVS